jgi:hypothetical protein
MPRFFIEVPHEDGYQACLDAIRVFMETGSHWLRQADWGCEDGEHAAWIIVEAETKEEASHVVPPRFRADAKVVQLNKFTPEQVQEMMTTHEG